MPIHSLLSKIFLFFCLFSANVEAIEKASSFTNGMPEKQFNQLWQERCLDAGERVLEMYLPALLSSSSKRKNLPFLFVTVSDNYHQKKTKCYRDSHLSPYIIQERGGLPSIYFPEKNNIWPQDIFILLDDYWSTSPLNEVITYSFFPESEISFDSSFVIARNDKSQVNGFEVNDNLNMTLFHLNKQSSNVFVRKNDFSYNDLPYKHFSTGSVYQYDAHNRELLSIDKWAKKFRVDSQKISVMIPSSGNPLTTIASQVANQLQSLNGLSLPKNWINGSGYLTLENGKKQKLPNRQRLEVWLKRYLARQQVKLETGKTYYFSKDLGSYLLMDYYKENGEPIYPQTKADICKRFEVQIPDACQR